MKIAYKYSAIPLLIFTAAQAGVWQMAFADIEFDFVQDLNNEGCRDTSSCALSASISFGVDDGTNTCDPACNNIRIHEGQQLSNACRGASTCVGSSEHFFSPFGEGGDNLVSNQDTIQHNDCAASL